MRKLDTVVTAVADHVDAESLHVDASVMVDYKKTAIAIVMQHPEIGTFVPDVRYRTVQQLVAKQPTLTNLWEYPSGHPAEGPDGRPTAGMTPIKLALAVLFNHPSSRRTTSPPPRRMSHNRSSTRWMPKL